MYRFDFSKLTPLDWVAYGQYGHYSTTITYYMLDKAALFSVMDLDSNEVITAVQDFSKQMVDYLNSYAAVAPNPPPAIETDNVPDVFKSFIQSLDPGTDSSSN